MGTRAKKFGAIAFIGIIGFLLGTGIYFVYSEALPVLAQIFPLIVATPWIVWGLTGALLAVICCLIYAYLPSGHI